MRGKRIKLIFFSLKGSEVKDFDLGWKKILLFSSMLFIIITILIGAGLSLFTDIYQNTQLSSLEKTNQNLMIQLKQMRNNIDQVKLEMQRLEGDDDDLRMIAGLDTIDQDIRQAGVGGPAVYSNEFNFFPEKTHEEIFDTRGQIDQLKRKIHLLCESRVEVNQALKTRQDEIDHLPTIKPVTGGRITSPFGKRIDPFTEKLAMHRGLDIGAPVGAKIHVAADGVVLQVKKTYNRNKGYGKLVVIDHGYGIRTKYAHMHKIYVRPGKKVSRWDVIGEVGETGRAHGAHLHYEVVKNNKPVNPFSYFFE